MNSPLASFLARHIPQVEEFAEWGGQLSLRITSYLSDELPPLEYVASVRSLVFRAEAILVLRNADSTHIVPGGRCEEGETYEQTLRREILEESGWIIADARLLGFMHLSHLKPKPDGYRYPYPDFFQLVFVANAVAYAEGKRLSGDYEVGALFRPIVEVRALGLTPGEKLYLDAALRRKRDWGI